jgi:hypothetical protein
VRTRRARARGGKFVRLREIAEAVAARQEPLCHGETEPEASQGGLFVTLDTGELGLGGHARVPLDHQLYPPPQRGTALSRG